MRGEPSQEIFDVVRAGDTGRLQALLTADPSRERPQRAGSLPGLDRPVPSQKRSGRGAARGSTRARHFRRGVGRRHLAGRAVAGSRSRAPRGEVERRILAARARRVLRPDRDGSALARAGGRSYEGGRSRGHEGTSRRPRAAEGPAGMMTNVDWIGWLATAVFLVSYFTKRPTSLRRVQGIAAGLWALYGVLIHSLPVIGANVLVASVAVLSSFRKPSALASPP